MGRPTKIEGNPLHPASLGSTDVFAQASVLDLWDPDRSQAVTHRGEVSTWEAFGAALERRCDGLAKKQGTGSARPHRNGDVAHARRAIAGAARALPGRRSGISTIRSTATTSTTERAWRSASRSTCAIASTARRRCSRSMPIFSAPARAVCATRAISCTAARRAAAAGTSNRLYAIASTPSLTSAFADHAVRASRERHRSSRAPHRQVARVAGGRTRHDRRAFPRTGLPRACATSARIAARPIVIAGDRQPADRARARACDERSARQRRNDRRTIPTRWLRTPTNQGESLRALARDMAARRGGHARS